MRPNCWKTHKVTVPGPVARKILLRATGSMIRVGQLIAPDQETTYYETLTAMTRAQRTDRSRRIRSFDEDFSAFFRSRHHLPPRQDRAADGLSDALPTEASFTEPDPALSETQLS
jgi:hypothetical protein